MNRSWSDEQINAFVDGELAPAEHAALGAQCGGDAALRERVAQLRATRELVRQAYASLPLPSGRRTGQPPQRARSAQRGGAMAVAAVVMFATGLAAGWLARATFTPATVQASATGMGVQAEHGRVVLHVSADANGQGLAALEHAEGLILAARDSGRSVTIEIVANGAGLDLLRAAVSPHAGRIEALRRSYPALSLVACGQTVQKLREAGADVRLLPGTQVASSALDQIVLRMQQGWTYVRI